MIVPEDAKALVSFHGDVGRITIDSGHVLFKTVDAFLYLLWIHRATDQTPLRTQVGSEN